MGIPGLARHLEPYTTHYSPDKLKEYSAIIDGPALAYHAHKLALASSYNQSKIPSYADIVTQGVRWLESLKSIDIKVSMVFFDGVLPLEKRPERLSRTEQNNRGVKQFRVGYPTAACPIPASLNSKLYAFLAPALREALSKSPFASRTCVVPGEADDWCALHAKSKPRSIIFTSDTDLILFNYASETLVCFLQDIDLLTGIRAYSPQQIRQKLQLKSLISFAFALKHDPSESTQNLVRKAKEVDVSSKEYFDFRNRYIIETIGASSRSKLSMSESQHQDLDVRVSEFVHEAQQDALDIFVYLPLLVEDPHQAAAWSMGQNIRTLAYSILAPPNSMIHEYKRKAQGISLEKVHPYVTSNIQTPAIELSRQITALVTWAESKTIEPEVFWPLFALSLVLTETKISPPLSSILRVLNGDFDNTWSFIQLTARLQAALYSLRMLKQITKAWLASNQKSTSKLFECLSELGKHFGTFPSIAEMFVVPGQKARVLAKHDHLKALVEEIYQSAGLAVPVETVPSKKKKKQTREAERKKKRIDQALGTKSTSSNAFSLLNQ